LLAILLAISERELSPATKWQRIGNQIDAAVIFARAKFVNVHSV
jgi:hypothetical protein